MGQRRRAGLMLDPLGLSTPALVGSSFASDEKGRCGMHVRILLQITADDGAASLTEEVTAFEKSAERPEDLGLSLAEGKAVTAAIQRHVVNAQVASWTERHRGCEACGVRRRSKGSSPVVFRTLYGDVPLASPRLHRCPCQDADGPATLLPLRTLIPGQIAPERLYLEARWSSLVPYAGAAKAARQSCSAPSTAMCRSRARGCTAARAKTRTVRLPCCRCAPSSLARSPPSGFIWKHAGHRSCPTLPQPGYWPTCCRSRPARTGPPCGSMPCGSRNVRNPSWATSGPASSMAVLPTGRSCPSRKAASWLLLMAATFATGTTGRATSS